MKMNSTSAVLGLFGVACMAGAPAHAAAAASTGSGQAYPAKPLRLIVALPAGGPTDILARLIAQPLSASLGQPVVVDNRPGAGGNIGAELAAKSPADGYTLFMGTSGPLAINPSLYRTIGFDPLRDFAPVILAASAPFVIVAHPSLAANNVKELIALATAKPGQINYGSVTGNASHLATELFAYMAGIKMTLVPYKGAAQATTDVIAGQIQLSFASTPGSVSLIKAGKLKAIAVTSAKRIGALPEVPTVAESGVPGYEASVWYGVVVPAKTPPAIVTKLNAEIAKILRERASRDKMAAADFEVTSSTPAEFGSFIRSETAKWTKVVKASGARAD
ncbi:MAG: tripartite tricarboxylate transporter substrate binding protein [Burkholderiales bacterium]